MFTPTPQLIKLQAHKSSYQAWKCVSFGCSLFAIILLYSKWYQVTTDLHLLIGIDQILQTNLSSNGSNVPISWSPIPIEEIPFGSLINESNSTIEGANLGANATESNDTKNLILHMHQSKDREQNGNQLLLKEVEVFIAEFKSAKSTLGLSSLLVSVYLISWILMTLAINDKRISNDVSLRNILLLSIFGAIDLAASIGFVMVRLIMYSVKNNPFVNELLSSGGLRDTPIKLSADQLTAFTALRLIALRSCTASVDVYVSIVVISLTILRLYSIIRAITYYKRLRQFADVFHLSQGSGELEHGQGPEAKIWTTPQGPQFHMITAAPSPGAGRITPIHMYPQQQHPMSHPHQGRISSEPAGGKMNELEMMRQQMVSPIVQQALDRNSQLLANQEHPVILLQSSPQPPRSKLNGTYMTTTELNNASQVTTSGANGSQPIQLLVSQPNSNGRHYKRRILGDDYESEPIRPGLSSRQRLLNHYYRKNRAEATLPSRINLSGLQEFERAGSIITESEHNEMSSRQNLVYDTTRKFKWRRFGDKLMYQREFSPSKANIESSQQPGPSNYTLLSADQLEKLSKRLIKGQSNAETVAKSSAANTTGRYKLVNKHRRDQHIASGGTCRPMQRQRREASILMGADSLIQSSDRSSGCDGPDDSESQSDSHSARRELNNSTLNSNGKLLGVRQTEEFVAVGDNRQQPTRPLKVFEIPSKHREYLLSKSDEYYDYDYEDEANRLIPNYNSGGLRAHNRTATSSSSYISQTETLKFSSNSSTDSKVTQKSNGNKDNGDRTKLLMILQSDDTSAKHIDLPPRSNSNSL